MIINDVYRMITSNRWCNVLKVNQQCGKNSIRCQTYAKTENNYLTQILFLESILGIPVTDFRPPGKCNICAFHEEIHAFEDWIFVR